MRLGWIIRKEFRDFHLFSLNVQVGNHFRLPESTTPRPIRSTSPKKNAANSNVVLIGKRLKNIAPSIAKPHRLAIAYFTRLLSDKE